MDLTDGQLIQELEMSDKFEGIDKDLLAAIIADPGINIAKIIELFSRKASKSTIKRRIKTLSDTGLISIRKGLVAKPTAIGKIFMQNENVGGSILREDSSHD